MTDCNLTDIYRGYIACLNRQNWANLGNYVGDSVIRNDQHLGLEGYRKMLQNDFAQIPDLYFDVRMLIAEPPFLASRIVFNCMPRGTFLDLPVNGRRVIFAEHVLYELRDKRIVQVWSVIDKAAIESQL